MSSENSQPTAREASTAPAPCPRGHARYQADCSFCCTIAHDRPPGWAVTALRAIAANMRAEGLGGSRPDVLDEVAATVAALTAERAAPAETETLARAVVEAWSNSDYTVHQFDAALHALSKHLAARATPGAGT